MVPWHIHSWAKLTKINPVFFFTKVGFAIVDSRKSMKQVINYSQRLLKQLWISTVVAMHCLEIHVLLNGLCCSRPAAKGKCCCLVEVCKRVKQSELCAGSTSIYFRGLLQNFPIDWAGLSSGLLITIKLLFCSCNFILFDCGRESSWFF